MKMVAVKLSDVIASSKVNVAVPKGSGRNAPVLVYNGPAVVSWSWVVLVVITSAAEARICANNARLGSRNSAGAYFIGKSSG